MSSPTFVALLPCHVIVIASVRVGGDGEMLEGRESLWPLNVSPWNEEKSWDE